MGNISLGHSSALDASGKLHEFQPGDELPDWVTAKRNDSNALAVQFTSGAPDEVGLIIARAENDAAGIIAKAEAEAKAILAEAKAQVASDPDANTEGTGDAQSDANGKGEESGEPDFTKPATPKRGRPRKAE
ncbi:hypothetical protein AOZ07_03065 [Glutamicibacter halophytocola]|uniref:hypothetical protein n=1 Tax=Glutamicibacter halophytocola TaxID=1933880 RepID=UPI0006D4AB5D|nr:hypothetical protein [Glutamicibacter halophytocola]ALG28079.1 hypothetical protein AOZ07_03065 [Glutamicibacter halophytocola]